MSPKNLSNHQLWWEGPAWLLHQPSDWPVGFSPVSVDASSELRPQKLVHVVQVEPEPELLLRYSSLNKLLRTTAWCQIFIARARKIPPFLSQPYLTLADLRDALMNWVRISQWLSFPADFKQLSKKLPVSHSSPLKNLNPFIDSDGLIRVGGKLDRSSLPYDNKYPFILAKDSTLSRLIITDVHLRTLHSNTRDTLSTVFWILGGRPTIKTHILRCVICAHHRAERAQQRWETGVKSVKYHLKRVFGVTSLTFEEYSTVLAQVKAVLNSRPLCKINEDPEDLEVLTPGHFLIGRALNINPQPNLSDIPTPRRSPWQLTRQIVDSFWQKWSPDYLQHLQSTYKWRFPSSEFQIGSIVLVVDEMYPPEKWPLARVLNLDPGLVGLTRVVTVKTSTSTFKRPLVKLCLLPVDVSPDHD